MVEIVFLGTSCMVPTKERNVQGIFLSYKNEGILVDCGEGTQRQMNIAGINRAKVTKVLISHWHGDHVSGLIGFFQTFANIEGERTLHLYGPKGTDEKVKWLLKMADFYGRLDLKVHELDPKDVEKFYETEDYYLECAYLRHKTRCLGYNFVEKDKIKINIAKAEKLGLKEGPMIGKLLKNNKIKIYDKEITLEDVSTITRGKKITFILDTVLCNNCYKLAENADLLISEACYVSGMEDKAEDYMHMTSKQAALLASNSNAKELIMTHFSQRYKTVEELEQEAKMYFPNSRAAFDFMKVKI